MNYYRRPIHLYGGKLCGTVINEYGTFYDLIGHVFSVNGYCLYEVCLPGIALYIGINFEDEVLESNA